LRDLRLERRYLRLQGARIVAAAAADHKRAGCQENRQIPVHFPSALSPRMLHPFGGRPSVRLETETGRVGVRFG
jgi:hypothetical protein